MAITLHSVIQRVTAELVNTYSKKEQDSLERRETIVGSKLDPGLMSGLSNPDSRVRLHVSDDYYLDGFDDAMKVVSRAFEEIVKDEIRKTELSFLLNNAD